MSESPLWVCACCQSPVAEVDVCLATDETGTTRLTAASIRGHQALVAMLIRVEVTVDDSQLPSFLDHLISAGLRVAKPATGCAIREELVETGSSPLRSGPMAQ
jgi:hypothetical protein